VDAHSADDKTEFDSGDYGKFNDVTFVVKEPFDAAQFSDILLYTTAGSLITPIPLARVGNSLFWSVTLKVPRRQRHRYRYVIDGVSANDPVNPQTIRCADGEIWSSFFTWEYGQRVVLEEWEFTLVDRLVREILPFNDDEARNYLERGAEAAGVKNLHRVDVSVGAANYIDKILAREERHQLPAYRTCLEMIAAILRKRNPETTLANIGQEYFERLYADMADPNLTAALVADGWNVSRYGSPAYFLYLLRRHAWTGAFSHPKYGGNYGAMSWAYLAESLKTTDPPTVTAFDWPRAIEAPWGRSTEYWG
jgi:hypothetical protein